MRTLMRGTSLTTLTAAALLTAACGSSSQISAGSTISSATAASPAASSPTARPSATQSAASASTSMSSPTAATSFTPAPASTESTASSSRSASTATIPPSLRGRVISRIPTSRRIVALTFDAGANGDGVDAILRTLAREKVPASFFLTGRFADSYPTLTRRMSAAGRLGNHSVSHPHLPLLTDARMQAQITGAETTLRRVAGEDPRPLFRFPFGDSTPREIRRVDALGYVAVGWTVDTLGWQGTSGGRSTASVLRRVLAAKTPGEIVLMHVGSHPTDHSTLDATALPQVISALRAAGYSFVTLDTLIHQPSP